jgi:hypothetical protein
VSNQQETGSKRKTYPSAESAFRRQAVLLAAGIAAGVVRAGDRWALTHDPDDAQRPHKPAEA